MSPTPPTTTRTAPAMETCRRGDYTRPRVDITAGCHRVVLTAGTGAAMMTPAADCAAFVLLWNDGSLGEYRYTTLDSRPERLSGREWAEHLVHRAARLIDADLTDDQTAEAVAVIVEAL